MASFLDDLRRWGVAWGETQALLRRNEELLESRAQLLRMRSYEFRGVVRLAHEFADRVSEAHQEPEARSGSPRSR